MTREMCGRNDDQKAAEERETCRGDGDDPMKRGEICRLLDHESTREKVLTDSKSNAMEEDLAKRYYWCTMVDIFLWKGVGLVWRWWGGRVVCW